MGWLNDMVSMEVEIWENWKKSKVFSNNFAGFMVFDFSDFGDEKDNAIEVAEDLGGKSS